MASRHNKKSHDFTKHFKDFEKKIKFLPMDDEDEGFANYKRSIKKNKEIMKRMQNLMNMKSKMR